MSKASYLIKNTGILAVGSFGSKILSFLLIPLYTAALTTSEYGSFDIVSSTIGLLIPILTLNIQDALLRFPLEQGADTPRLARIGIGFTMLSGIVVLAFQLMPGMPWSSVDGRDFIAALYIVSAIYQLLIILARGCERMALVAIAGVINTAVAAVLNIVLLLVFDMGLTGFFLANIGGMTAPIIILVFALRDVILAPSSTRKKGLFARMVLYSVPLAMTTIGWWFINMSGRFIVITICGVDANGLYSIAFKLPIILTTLAGVFTQAWQVSAIKEYDPDDSDGFLLKTFDMVEMLLVLVCSIIILLSPALAFVLFSGEFYNAWVYSPFLLVLVLLNTMSGIWGPFFSAGYNTTPMAVSTILGGIANVIIGIPLAMLIGVWGVIIANVAAGLVNWAYRGIKVRRYINVDFHMGQSLTVYSLLVLQGCTFCLVFLPISCRVLLSLLITIALLVVYRKRLGDGLRLAVSLIRSQNNS